MKNIEMFYLSSEQKLPLVIKRQNDSLNLTDWVLNNKKLIDNKLLTNGAILFRNFNIKSI